MAWKLTLAAADKTADMSGAGVSVEWTLNGRATASFTCRPGLIPDPLDAVVIYAQDGATKLFGGVVLPTGRTVTGANKTTSDLFCAVTCGDWATYTDWRYVTLAYTTGPTLKAVLLDLVADYLTDYSITLDAGQVTGPTLAAFSWDGKRASDCLRDLSDQTGYVWRIDPDKVLKMFLPGTDAAPYSLTDAAPHCQDVSWSDNSQSDATPTRVILKYGPPGTVEQTSKSWAGDGVTDVWTLDDSPESTPTGLVNISGTVGGVWTSTNYYIGSAFTWTACALPDDPAARNGGVLTRGWAPIPTADEDIRLFYTRSFPLTIKADSLWVPPVETVVARPDITGFHEAWEAVDTLLANIGTAAVDLEVLTLDHGFLPGQALTVDLTSRGLDLVANITSVSARLVTDTHWEYSVKATSGTTYRGSSLDQWRTLFGSGRSGIKALPAPAPATESPDKLAAARMVVDMGGAREDSVACGTTPTVIPFYRYYDAPTSFTGTLRVEVKARTAGHGVTPELYDVTAAAVNKAGTKITNTAWVSQDVPVTLIGGHQYVVRAVTDNAAGAYYAMAKLVW